MLGLIWVDPQLARDAHIPTAAERDERQNWTPEGQDDFEGVAEILDAWTWEPRSVTVEGQIDLESYRMMAGLTSRASRANRESTPVFDAVVSAYDLERFLRWKYGLATSWDLV
jgi:hypothetical protein